MGLSEKYQPQTHLNSQAERCLFLPETRETKREAFKIDQNSCYYKTSILELLLLLLLLFTAIGFSPGGSSPYTSTHNTNVFTRWQ
jgi:hypothetical protein